jgi:hypothetical protein
MDGFKISDYDADIEKILRGVPRYENGERCYISDYQIAASLADRRKEILTNFGIRVGGKGVEKHRSLAQIIGKHLSSSAHTIPVERTFFSTKDLDAFKFSDNGEIRDPSVGEFALFRLKNTQGE